MDGLVFRNDDISPNTDFENCYWCYAEIEEKFPNARIISAVSLFGKKNDEGSVYPGVPFKDNPLKWFCDVDSFIDISKVYGLPGELASHGLLHIDHESASRDTQELSILTSCEYLETKIFVPPFNRYNADTVSICQENGIEFILPEEGWKNLEIHPFNPEHKFWYFHSWRVSAKSLKEKLNGHSPDVG